MCRYCDNDKPCAYFSSGDDDAECAAVDEYIEDNRHEYHDEFYKYVGEYDSDTSYI